MEITNKKYKFTYWLLAIIIIINTLLGVNLIIMQNRHDKENTQVLKEHTEKQINNILKNLYHSVDMVEQLVVSNQIDNNQNINELDAFLKPIIQDYGYRNISILPDGIVDYVYPLKDNEKFLGLNIFANPDKKNEVDYLISSKTTTLSGPYKMANDVQEFIMRKAIFKSDDSLWGFVSVVMDQDVLLQKLNVIQFSNTNYQYEFTATLNGLNSVLITKSADFDSPKCENINIKLSNGYLNFKFLIESQSCKKYIIIVFVLTSFVISLIIVIHFIHVKKNLHTAHNEAHFDKLTGVYNRKILDTLEKTLIKKNLDYTVVHLDLNDFKEINDTYGHKVGDQVLQSLAHRLKSITRESDYIIRMGGDEFIVVFPNLNNDNISIICNRLNDIQISPLIIGNHNIAMSFSYGYAIKDSTQQSLESVIEKADTQMYHAKNNFKNNRK